MFADVLDSNVWIDFWRRLPRRVLIRSVCFKLNGHWSSKTFSGPRFLIFLT